MRYMRWVGVVGLCFLSAHAASAQDGLITTAPENAGWDYDAGRQELLWLAQARTLPNVESLSEGTTGASLTPLNA